MSTTSSRTRPQIRRAVGRRFLRRHRPRPQEARGSHRSLAVRAIGLVALVGLMGLTSWFLATVSPWLVPVYAVVMVLIFAAPRATGPKGRVTEAEDASPRHRPDAPGKASASAGANIRPDRGEAVEEDRDEAPALDSGPSAAALKPRRSRGRARKGTKPGSDSAAASAVVTWVRVGPGKFVRADSQEPLPNVSSELPDSTASVEETAADEGQALDPPGLDAEPVPEEYGIAPSALGPGPVAAEPALDGTDLASEAAQPSTPPGSAAEPLPEAYLEANPVSRTLQESLPTEAAGPAPAVLAEADTTPVRTDDDEDAADSQWRAGGSARIRQAPGRRRSLSLRCAIQAGINRLERIVGTVRPARPSAVRGRGEATPRPRAPLSRSHGRYARIHRGFQSRSPPCR